MPPKRKHNRKGCKMDSDSIALTIAVFMLTFVLAFATLMLHQEPTPPLPTKIHIDSADMEVWLELSNPSKQ